MCGIAGVFDSSRKHGLNGQLLTKMSDTLVHRGPDDSGHYLLEEDGLGLCFRRLSIIDLDGGNQPLFNEDKSKVLVCNGEIYNYRELRELLLKKGHTFRTNVDVEVLLHLYEEYGTGFLNMLNGQFAFVLYDITKKSIFLVRDHVGIAPLFYALQDDVLIFASEIKAILAHPVIRRQVNPEGLDQILGFPGLVSPVTMFKGVHALKPGHYLLKNPQTCEVKEYWDVNYPREGEADYRHNEDYYAEGLLEALKKAVKYRLNADVPVGFYLSGGLDSSFIGSLIQEISPVSGRDSFSITFPDKSINEEKHQQLMARHLNSSHHEFLFDYKDIAERIRSCVYHAETPLKETYNTCSLALSKMVKQHNIKVVLTGEGADELFAGYVGYRFDKRRADKQPGPLDLEAILEQQTREKIWGDADFKYEKDFHVIEEIKEAIYSDGMNRNAGSFSSIRDGLIDKSKIQGRSPLHKRSYLDFKLRISDHLVADHGDRVSYANSIEARYPFLDVDVINYAATIPGDLKLCNMEEKYILKKSAARYVPASIINREKFSFVAPGSPFLLKQNIEWVHDMLSCETIRRQGFFNPDTVCRLKKMYLNDNFSINQTFESDLLMIILTFGIFLEEFRMPDYN